ncbi:hypothetical protein ACFW04_007840 [Cataglyphis niger]
MSQNYKSKTERQSWSEESMAAAIKDIIEGKIGYKKAAAQEKELMKHILILEERFDLTLINICKLAFQIAEKYNIPHTFNRKKERTGKDWLYSFLSRHKELSLKKNSRKTSIACAKNVKRTI